MKHNVEVFDTRFSDTNLENCRLFIEKIGSKFNNKKNYTRNGCTICLVTWFD